MRRKVDAKTTKVAIAKIEEGINRRLNTASNGREYQNNYG